MTDRLNKLIATGRMNAEVIWKNNTCYAYLRTPDDKQTLQVRLTRYKGQEMVTVEGRCVRAVARAWALYVIRNGLCAHNGATGAARRP